MKALSSLLIAAVILFSLSATGGSEPDSSESTYKEPVQGPLTSRFTAQVVSGGLRIRSFPRTSADIIAVLAKGDLLHVLSQTSWTDKIDGITAPWFEVCKGWAAGWCFGGYLAPSAKADIPRSTIVKREKVPLHSYFGNADGSKVGSLSYLSMMITGVEEPYSIPSREGFHAAFDVNNNTVFLEVRPTPAEVIHIDATDAKGDMYSKDLARDGDPRYLIVNSNKDGFKYSNPVTGFTFRPPASVHGGDWHFKVVPDKNVSATNSFKISIGTASATLASVQRPDPFDYPATVTAQAGDLLYLFGANAVPNSRVNIAFYQITRHQNKDLSFTMRPSVAAEIRVDKAGRYRTSLRLGSDLEPGAYKFASGEDTLSIDLFDIYLVIR